MTKDKQKIKLALENQSNENKPIERRKKSEKYGINYLNYFQLYSSLVFFLQRFFLKRPYLKAEEFIKTSIPLTHP